MLTKANFVLYCKVVFANQQLTFERKIMLLEKLTLKEARNTEGFVNHDTPNKSMDVRAKQRLCFGVFR